MATESFVNSYILFIDKESFKLKFTFLFLFLDIFYQSSCMCIFLFFRQSHPIPIWVLLMFLLSALFGPLVLFIFQLSHLLSLSNMNRISSSVKILARFRKNIPKMNEKMFALFITAAAIKGV